MRTNPKPDYRIPLPHRECPIRQAHAGRKDRSRSVDLFEAQTRVKGILPKELVRETGLGLHLRRQGGEGLAKPPGRVGGQS